MVNFLHNLLSRFMKPTSDTVPAVAASPIASSPTHTVTPVVPPSPLPAGTEAMTTRIESPTISIMNVSTVVSDTDVQKAIVALQIQLDRDFSPVWGVGATLKFLPRSTPLPVNHWLITIMDNSDQQGALGYHDLTVNGLPVSKIFAKDDQKYGLSWSVTLSHELLEMLVDPWISNCSFAQETNTTGVLYAFEVADPVEDDSSGYEINGVKVSNFVYPAWFEGFRQPNSTKFDFRGNTHRPFQLAKGGYISQFVVGPSSQGWNQITAETVPTMRNKKSSESRTVRRKLARKPDMVKRAEKSA